MCHLRPETLVSALAVFTSLWPQHEPFQGRDTCERAAMGKKEKRGERRKREGRGREREREISER